MQLFKNILKIENKNKRYGPYKSPNLGEVLAFYNLDENKVVEYASKIFNSDCNGFHDSRFDTTAMFVLTNLAREAQSNTKDWANRFCK
jgi:hypothetical protein